MTQREVDILLKAIGAVSDDVKRLDDKFEDFRTYADQTYVRRDVTQTQADTSEAEQKRKDRLYNRTYLTAISLLSFLSFLFSALHK